MIYNAPIFSLRLSFATDIARALAYLHAHSIIHRDLKGENLLITENYRLKVCDFGFSRTISDDESKRLSYCGTVSIREEKDAASQPTN
jgi:serine/threonine protein kinase